MGEEEEMGGVEGGETIIRIYCMKKSIFNKREQKKLGRKKRMKRIRDTGLEILGLWVFR